MGKRNYVEEILSIRLRNELNPRWGGALIQLRSLEHSLQTAPDLPIEMVRYFPIALVAIIESYFRSAIRELVDFGPPFSDNAAGFDRAKDIPLDFRTVLAIQGKTITIGELVAHVLPIKRLEDIDRNMTTIIGQSFLNKLKSIQDRWAIEVEGAAPAPIIDSPSDVYQEVSETFRLRHVYCHEIAWPVKVDIGVITKCFRSSSLFLKAADQLVWDIVAPNAPLTQSAMNVQAFTDFSGADQRLQDLCSDAVLFLSDEEKKEFKATNDAWRAFRELEASSYANRWGRGGSIWATLNSARALSVTNSRIEGMKEELDHLQKVRPHLAKER